MQRSEGTATASESGFFLTDALVGLFVLASVAGGLLAAFGLARSVSEKAEHMAKALVIAKSCIEEKKQEIGSTLIQLGNSEFRRLRVMELMSSGENDVVELVRITCAASWTDRDLVQEVRLQRLEARAKQ
jgi:hypothetical protein